MSNHNYLESDRQANLLDLAKDRHCHSSLVKSYYSKSQSALLFSVSLMWLLTLGASSADAKKPFESYSTISVPATSSSYTGANDNLDYTFGNGSDLYIESFTAGGGKIYTPRDLADQVLIRREDNLLVTGERCNIFLERSGSGTGDINSATTFPNDTNDNCSIVEIFKNLVINRGVLDLFSNSSSANSEQPNNIERVDFVYTNGITAPTNSADLQEVGHIVMEKNGNNPAKVAAITAIDAAGNPTQFSSIIVTINTTDYGRTGAAIENNFLFDPSTSGEVSNPEYTNDRSEPIGGVLVTLADFGIAAGDTYFGFAMFPTDVADDADLLATNNFPDNTPHGVGNTGGADWQGGMGAFWSSLTSDVDYDYGDAPDTYGTDTTGGNSSNGSDPVGASHIIDSRLYLGGTVPDAEINGFVDGTDDNDNATDDDLAGTDDEDDFILPTLTEGDTSYTIPAADITATNTIFGAGNGSKPTGINATLHAWIDFNKNGTFEETEYASTEVAQLTNGGNPVEDLTWTGITAGAAGNTYARFRLTTDSSINNTTPGGAASDGEVEDYQIAIETGIGTVGGQVFNDDNHDGILDPGETGVDVVTVELYNAENELQDTITTAGGGFYEFTNLPSGEYYVSVEPPSNTVLSPQIVFDRISHRTENFSLQDGDNLNFNAPLATDTDGDFIADVNEQGDRDGDGITDAEDIDPAGFFYDETTGEIISGGSISVTGPNPDSVNLVDDGADGSYQFFGTEAGTYEITVNSPPGYEPSAVCGNSGSFDPTDGSDPTSLGSGENGTTGFLVDSDCGSNTFYLTFELEAGDPLVINNNFAFQASDNSNQTVDDTPSATSCSAQGGTLTGDNLYIPLDGGTMGFENGSSDQSPATNPYPEVEVTGGDYAQYNSGSGSFLNPTYGQYSYVANVQNPRNSFQHNGITDPVYGAIGRFFISDPDNDTPTMSITLNGLTPNKFYEYSFWAANAEPNGASANNIDIVIDGQTVYNTGDLPFVTSALAWKKHFFTFTTGSNTSVTVDLASTKTGNGGNDFYLDNIELIECGFPADYGDAPDTYGTDDTGGNSSNTSDPVGASHIIDSDLFLGATVPDAETNGFVDGTDDNGNASDDDLAGTDDEDDLTLPTLTTGDTSYTIPAANITATNTTGQAATLHAWIDFDNSGTFEATEHTSVAVNDLTNGGNPVGDLTWTGITAGAAGNTYARFRLTTDSNVTASTPGGAASDGEVEDYQIAIAVPFDTSAACGIDDPPSTPDGTPSSYANDIYWFDWSGAGTFANGSTRTLNFTLPDGRNVDVEVDITNESTTGNVGVEPVIVGGNRPLALLLKGVQNSTDIGGSGANSALRTNVSGQFDNDVTVSFKFSQRLSIFYADGEASGGTNPPSTADNDEEHVNAITNGEPWVILDSRNHGTGFSLQTSSGGKNLLFSPLEESENRLGLGTPLAISRDATEFQAVLDTNINGRTGVALGVLLPDVGDAPASYGIAAHQVNDLNCGTAVYPYLGTQAPDGEDPADVQSASADGDNSGTGSGRFSDDAGTPTPSGPGDEDGVQLNSSLLQGQSLTQNSDITLDITTVQSGVLNAWIDWNGNDQFDSGEQIATNVASSGGIISLPVTVPSDAQVGTTYARFRYGSEADLGPTSYTIDGEVEDYQIAIALPSSLDYGDAPDTYGTDNTGGNSSNTSDPVGASHVIDSRLYLGDTIPDAETNGFVDGTDDNGNATDDDEPSGTGTGNGDDEDDFAPPILSSGATSYTIPEADITATNTTGEPAFLHAWIDFDNSGTFEANEHTSVAVDDLTDGGNPVGDLTWTGITAGAAGNTYARFRLTTDGSIDASTPGGAATDGEVEDYQVTIAEAAPTSTSACPGIIGDLWFANDESGSVSPDEFDDALDFLYQISDGLEFDSVDGFQAGITAWTDQVNSVEVIMPIGELYGDPGDSGLFSSSNITTNGNGQGIRELYSSRQNSRTGTRLDHATRYLANLITAGNGSRPGVPQVAVILTDADSSFIENPDKGGNLNWLAAASGLQATGAQIVLVLIDEAATAYNAGGTSKIFIDSVAGTDGIIITVPDYAAAADPVLGHIDAVTQAICDQATPTAGDPGLLLTKRITAVNPGQPDEEQFNSFVDDPNTENDNHLNWPDSDENPDSNVNAFMRGEISVDVQPDDEVEYTIYFLSNGQENALNTQICDTIPDNMTFINNGYGIEVGIAMGLSATGVPRNPTHFLSNVLGDDEGDFYGAGTAPPEGLCKKYDSASDKLVPVDGSNNTNGAIVVNPAPFLPPANSPGNPADSYGFIRFRAKIK